MRERPSWARDCAVHMPEDGRVPFQGVYPSLPMTGSAIFRPAVAGNGKQVAALERILSLVLP